MNRVQRTLRLFTAIGLIAALSGCGFGNRVDDVARALGITSSEATTLLKNSDKSADDWIRAANEASADNNAAIFSACVLLIITDTGGPRTASNLRELMSMTEAMSKRSPIVAELNNGLEAASNTADYAAAAALVIGFDQVYC